MKKVAGHCVWTYPNTELEAFAKFGSDLDQATQRRLIRGERIVEVLKQPQYSPMKLEDQVMAIYIATRGYLDDIPVNNIGRFEKEFLSYVYANYPELPEKIRTEADLSEETEEKLVEIIKEFKENFIIRGFESVGGDNTDETGEAKEGEE